MRDRVGARRNNPDRFSSIARDIVFDRMPRHSGRDTAGDDRMAAEPHYEQQYLDLLREVWEQGDERRDRTGIGTRSLFGPTLRFSLADDAIPLLTTKRVAWKTAAREMLWFLTGDTNIRALVAQKVHIWTDWPLARYRAETGEAIDRDGFEARIVADDAFAARWGDLGPVYGKQWVDWPRYHPVAGEEGLYRRAARGIDQISALIDGLKRNPASRRHLFTGWNVAELDGMALPPCHMTYQFHVAQGRLSGMLWQRSCDLGLGFAFNAFSAALLIRMIAQQCGLEPGQLIWSGGDAHVYLNHEHLVTEQLTRAPRGQPKLRILRTPASIFDYRIEDFAVEDYDPHPHIAAPVAV
jgi:thymidylate synthase